MLDKTVNKNSIFYTKRAKFLENRDFNKSFYACNHPFNLHENFL